MATRTIELTHDSSTKGTHIFGYEPDKIKLYFPKGLLDADGKALFTDPVQKTMTVTLDLE